MLFLLFESYRDSLSSYGPVKPKRPFHLAFSDAKMILELFWLIDSAVLYCRRSEGEKDEGDSRP